MNDIVTETIQDTSIQIDKHKYSMQDFLEGVDTVLEKIDETGDFEVGMKVLKGMTALSQAAGLSLAKLLHGMYTRWPDDDEDEFYDELAGYTTIKRITVERYVNAWSALQVVPDDYRDQMYLRPTRDLVKLGEAWSQGYTPKKDQWSDLLMAQNSSEFAATLRGVKNAKPRKSSLTLYLERDGSIYAYQDGNRKYAGSVNLAGAVDDATIRKAVERISKGSNLIRR